MLLSKQPDDKSGKDLYNLLFMGEVPASIWNDPRCDISNFEKIIRERFVRTSTNPLAFRTNSVMKISTSTYFGSIISQLMFFLGNISFILLPVTIYFIPIIGIILLHMFLIVYISIKMKYGKTRGWTSQQKLELMYRSKNFLKQIKYFSMRYVWPSSLEISKGPRIFALVPHGIVPYSLESMLYFRMIFGRIPKIAVADILLKIPILRDVNLIRGVSSSMAKIGQALENNEDVILVCDGIAGMFKVNGGKGDERVITPRFGLAKLALLHGATIIPCYGFGHNHIHTLLADPCGFLESLSRFLRMSITPYFGLFGLPVGRRLPITLAFGNGISVTKENEPSRSSIQTVHKELLEGLTRTFDTHKHGFGWGDKKLIFV